jgi:hypothetical protein
MSKPEVNNWYIWRNVPLTKWKWKIVFVDGAYLGGSAWRRKTAQKNLRATLASIKGENK